MSASIILSLTAAERTALIEQTLWLCGGMTIAMMVLVFVAWWFLYPGEAG
jgi:hypothetical protein